MSKIDMKNIGLSERFINESTLYPNLSIGRIVSQYRDLYKVISEDGEYYGKVSGKFRYNTKSTADYPAVGDFVMMDKNDDSGENLIIHHILSRKSVFIRKAAGTSNNDQIVASNIDTVFICMSLNNDFNLRRLERYISIAWDSGAVPVIVLTKADLCSDIDEKISEIDRVLFGVDVIVTTSENDEGYIPVLKYLKYGETIAFLGSSGVGKSTLINKITGVEILETKEIRNDDKGRHTSTRREMIVIPDKGVLIDTPGMREIGIDSADLSKTFADIDELSHDCKFNDCTHTKEPKCAVLQAVRDGLLSEKRLASYHKLKKEAKYDELNSKQIENEKLSSMFKEYGGIKNARKYIKEKNKRK